MDLEDFPQFEPKNIIKTYSKTASAKSAIGTQVEHNTELKTAAKDDMPTKKAEELSTKDAITFLLAGTLKCKVCKYCLNVTEELYELQSVMEIANKSGLYSVTIKDMISSFHPFKVADDPNFPNKICNKCLDRTISSYLFTQQCEQTQRALINCFEDINTKLSKLDPIDQTNKRGRKKIYINHNKIDAEHLKVIDYADPIINIVNTSSEPLSTEPVINPLECLKCFQLLPNLESLVNHSKLHPKSMWFTCRLCAKSFPKLYSIKRHFREHQCSKCLQQTDENRFNCKECGETSRHYYKHIQHLEKHKFKMVLEHMVNKKIDDLCSVCFDKGSLVPLDKIVCIHGGPPDLMGDRTMQSILTSALPGLQMNLNNQYIGSKICEKCVNNAITAYTFMMSTYFIRDRLNTCISHMLDNLGTITAEQNICIEIANNIIMPIKEPVDEIVFEAEDTDNEMNDENEEFLEDEYRVKSEEEIEPETERKSINEDVDIKKIKDSVSEHKREIKNEVHLNGYHNDVYQEFLTFNNKPKPIKVKKRLTCPICDKYFLSDYFVKRHILNHVSNKVQCGMCSSEFDNKFSLNEHTKYAHVLFQKEYTACKVCGRSFTKAEKLEDHVKKHKNKVCMLCNKMFKDQGYFNSHMKRHAPKLLALKKIYGKACSFCEKECANENQLSLHVNKVHLQIKPYSCDMCEKQYYTENNLRFHKKIHSAISKEKCHFCNKIVNSRKLLVVHIRKHIGVTPHGCMVCNKAFYSTSKLKQHMNLIHGGNFVCKICKEVSVSKSELKIHVDKAHSFNLW